jgi:pRiA4b ORF-3-like protein
MRYDRPQEAPGMRQSTKPPKRRRTRLAPKVPKKPAAICTLTVKCVSGLYFEDECVRVIEIGEDATLEDLHLAIQAAVAFDNDHLYDFYAGRNRRNRQIAFVDDDEWEEREAVFAELTLGEDVYPLEGLKLYYHFDFGDDWIFEIRKARKEKACEPGVAYPRVIERRGPDPTQYPEW